MWLHRFAALTALATAILIFAGGLVTSTGSGLSVPDWPNTYGWFMFAFPLDKMVGGIFYEHGHRLIASVVGLLILVLAIWLWRTEPRAWVRRLGLLALAGVIVQGILGGITVLWFLPAPISIAHAGLAQIVFCLSASIALVTSQGWRESYRSEGQAAPSDRVLQQVALATTVVVFGQVLVGATMRHTGAGLAIPDFPLAFGRLIPPMWDARIAINFTHRLGALAVSVLVLATAGHVFYHHGRRRELRNSSVLLLVLLTAQVTLGAFTVLTGKQFVINSLHVVTGGLVLVTTLMLALRANRPRFEPTATDTRTGRAPALPTSTSRGLRPEPTTEARP